MSPGQDEPGGPEAEARLCVWSEGRQAKEDAILRKKRERFEAALRKLHAGLSKPRYLKRYDRVLEKVGRLKETHSLVAKQYEIKVKKGEKQRGKVLAQAVTLRRSAEHERGTERAGSYVLRTSHTDWDLERVVRTYWRLTDIEATFRSLKGEVGLRPVYHTKAERIRAHLFIAVLAYHGVHFLRQRLAQAGRRDSWATLRGKLSRWTRVTTTLQAADGSGSSGGRTCGRTRKRRRWRGSWACRWGWSGRCGARRRKRWPRPARPRGRLARGQATQKAQKCSDITRLTIS